MEEYMKLALGYKNEIIHIKYEDFLLNPKENIYNVLKFIGYENDLNILSSLEIDSSRAYAYKGKKISPSLLERIEKMDLISQLGYKI